ncbi:MAG TPA: single-stranded DNA-binding protein [Candidatus Hydrogenedentes bacterium]|nr:single-stranded DNA-binding protein [Candidatus Hydrogenedentota bacterium]
MADLRMPDLNQVLLAGRLTSDPELRYTSAGTPVCKMRLAASRYYKSAEGERREDKLYVDVTAWRATAEYCGENLRKGRPIIVEGRLKMNSWEDKASGEKRNKLEIVANRIQTLDWEDRAAGGASEKPAPRAIEEPVPEDDIPF